MGRQEGSELVFSCTNTAQFNVLPRLKQDPKTNKYVGVSGPGGQYGLECCAALTCMWIKRSHEITVTSASQLEKNSSPVSQSWPQHHHHLIAQASFLLFKAPAQGLEAATLDLFDVNNLKSAKRWKMAAHLCLNEVAGNDGFYYVDVGPHAMGFRKDANAYYFFDPNEGLYRFKTAARFIDAAKTAIEDDWSGWDSYNLKWLLHRVTLE